MNGARAIPATPATPATPERPGGAAGIWRFVLSELKPKGPLLTAFNLISVPIIVAAAVILYFRFTKGLSAVTNLTQDVPWGLWIGFDVVTGVAFAGGAYVITFLVYILHQERYHPIVRVTVLNGFLAYVFYAGALLLDLGRPWAVINPIIGNSFGVSSVLFLVAWHFMLYMMAAFLEFSPAVAEWLGLRRLRRVLAGLTVGAVIFGVTLSMLHQSGLGALYLMAKGKIHPLWYSEFIPIYFFVSSIFAGLSLVIFEGTISRRVFRTRISEEHHAKHDDIVLGLSKICAGTMFAYLFLKVLDLVHGQKLGLLTGSMGPWYLVEMIGFVLVPMILFTEAVRWRSQALCKAGAIFALVGILLNRLNTTVIGFRWDAAVRYVPSVYEVVVTLGVVLAEIWVFRWVINRMPVMSDSPAWVRTEAARPAAERVAA
ncbi:MAG TPA: NrfD/PsrC family molybdoenzyme membrane anchor subunit [Candidatus Eisenbacteria bacterium]|nr:NrfD/PsrC family molybdoenzyme membrane anchor subunit [Candidatus Eisenbacteria bacterium]